MRASPRTLSLTVVIGCVLASAWCSGTPSAPTPAPATSVAVVPETPEPPVTQPPIPTSPPTTTSGGTWINVFGDTGWCGSPGMAPLARLLSELGGDTLLAGDLAYENGRLEQFRRCFEPDFGRFMTRVWTVPGNHEYETAGASDYFTYFGARAGPGRRGYYAIRLATWQVLMLDSNVALGRNSPQLEWVRQQLEQDPTRCTMAVMHHPFDTSGPNGPHPHHRDLWGVLYDLGADVVIAAHDHLYERHAPQDPSQRADPVRGIRLFIAGTGGARPYARARAAAHSEVLLSTYGVLRLKLEPALYEWEFRDVSGATLDRGLNICH